MSWLQEGLGLTRLCSSVHLLVTIQVVSTAVGVTNPEEYVNVLGGTKSRMDMSGGNVLPETQVPWGFNGWAPTTEPDQLIWFYPESTRFYGIRCTHQPSPWMGDYATLRLMAHVYDDRHSQAGEFSLFKSSQSLWYPYYQKHTLLAYGNRNGYLTMEVAPTEHAAVMRLNFPRFDAKEFALGLNQTRRVTLTLDGTNCSIDVPETGPDGLVVLRGSNPLNPVRGRNGKLHFYMTIATGINESTPVKAFDSGVSGARAFFDFEPQSAAGDVMIVRIATSLISPEQAQANHDLEVKHKTFDSVENAAKELWHKLLSRVDVGDLGPGYTDSRQKEILTSFYSSMYRAAKYPRKLDEIHPETREPIHWSPYSGQVEQGVLAADSGFWDAYRTLYSWVALIAPERLAEMMEGWANAYLEGGWVPQWAHPGPGDCMTGTMSDVSMSEAIVKLPHCGTQQAEEKGYCVNASLLYKASRKHAFEVSESQDYGRVCLREYMDLGYIPSTCSNAQVSRSMNYWHADYAIGNAARFLGKEELKKIDPSFENDAENLLQRSKNWVKLLDPETGFFRNKDANGNFVPGFDEFAWGPQAGYTEAGPWQYRLEVPYDPEGLKNALDNMGLDGCDIVQLANTIPSTFHIGSYNTEIHEMSEMAINSWSQWEVNDQPVWALQHMQVGFDTAVTGRCASQAQKWLRQTNSLLTSSSDMYPGDEDNGSMGAWFLMNMLGLYPLSPASGNYVVGSPMFANVTIMVPGAATPLMIKATNQSPENVYVQSLHWNGQQVDGVELKYSDLMAGGILHFTMGSEPVAKDATVF